MSPSTEKGRSSAPSLSFNNILLGKAIARALEKVMGEPERPVSLKTAAKESREASAALAGNDAHEDIGQDAR